VRICSQKQMDEPYKLVDVPDEHAPARNCWKHLLTKPPSDSKQGPTDMSSFRETCTVGTQRLFNNPGPQPPTGPPPAATSQASSSNTVAPNTLLRQSSAEDCGEPPIKVQKRDGQAWDPPLPPPTPPAEEVQKRCPDANAQGASTSSVQARSPTTPRGAPVTPPGLIDGSPSSAEMTCPTTVARVASEHDAKSAKLYSPENWKDHINFRRSIITRI
jgi:hypothetical protein